MRLTVWDLGRREMEVDNSGSAGLGLHRGTGLGTTTSGCCFGSSLSKAGLGIFTPRFLPRGRVGAAEKAFSML